MMKYSAFGIATLFVSRPPLARDRVANWDFTIQGMAGTPAQVNDTTPQVCTGDDADYMNVVFAFLASHANDFDPSQNGVFSMYAGYCWSEKVQGIWQALAGLTLVPQFRQYWTQNLDDGLNRVQRYLKTCDGCKYWPTYPCYEPVRPVTHCLGASSDDPFVWDWSLTHSTAQYAYDAAVNEGHHSAILIWGAPTSGHVVGHLKAEWTIRCLGMLPECPESCWDGRAINHLDSQCKRCSPTKAQLLAATPNMNLVHWSVGTPGVRNQPQPRPPTSKCVHTSDATPAPPMPTPAQTPAPPMETPQPSPVPSDATPAPSISPTATSENCRLWCGDDSRPWSMKCAWSHSCNHCSDCVVPTEAPTVSPTGIAENCRPWCGIDSRPWSVKCAWPHSCNHCSDCVVPTEAPTVSPTGTSENCRSWCGINPTPWTVKCNWLSCDHCSDCTEEAVPTEAPTTEAAPPPAHRRLTSNNETSSEVLLDHFLLVV